MTNDAKDKIANNSNSPIDETKEAIKKSVFLPKTDFPMRAGLATKEQEIVARWQEIDLYGLLRQQSQGRPKFILHDGPPYANGTLHIGHAVNKILKDVITRMWQMQGFDSNYVPGWDCHGLPIEWKVEEDYRAKGRVKNSIPVAEFRKTCRDFANHWIEIQKAEFQRLGVVGDWKNPYRTMDYAAEAQIFRELTKFLDNGGLYAGSKPVLWSVVEETALADAEVEYEDITSMAIYLAFKVVKSPIAALAGASVLIWTTTPWTIPGNRAVAYNPEIEYVLVKFKNTKILPFLVAKNLLQKLDQDLKTHLFKTLKARDPDFVFTDDFFEFEVVEKFKGADFKDTLLAHPLSDLHSDYAKLSIPMLPGDHVTEESGTGLVHIAPGHGVEDFEIGMKHGLEMPITVMGDGVYAPHVPLFAGQHVFKVDPMVIDALGKCKSLIEVTPIRHSYPHSWRSKKKLIFRNTPQWFISMETNALRQKALAGIEATKWYPPAAKNRLKAMIEQRPDWCISRQRSWGVPLAVFVHKASGQPLKDAAVNKRIADAFEAEGGDAWFNAPPERFLGDKHKPSDYDQIKDVIEVWFDSGATHSYVLDRRADLHFPADLYLEGTDQHRGWFHTSLLESAGTKGVAPFKAVLTHGFALDPQGRKMSKSLGNVVAPQDVAKSHGVDILRLWVISCDYTEDLRIGADILNQQADLYRRLRNSLRYLLGGLANWQESERVDYEKMPDLEKYILAKLAAVDQMANGFRETYQYQKLYGLIHEFCAVDLSAFYFDIRKDSLYCDAVDSIKRRSNRTVMYDIFHWLVRWLAPVLCFTAEEAWALRPNASNEKTDSIHCQAAFKLPNQWSKFNESLETEQSDIWKLIHELRNLVLKELEIERAKKTIGSGLEACPTLVLPQTTITKITNSGIDLAEITITSELHLQAGNSDEPIVKFNKSPHPKCDRCWKHTRDVKPRKSAMLCDRCDTVLAL